MSYLFIILIIGILFLFLFYLLNWSSKKTSIIKYQDELNKIDTKKYQKSLKKLKNGDSTLIGNSGKRKVYVSNNAKHIFICGTTGSGKTITLSNFIKSIFDYKYPSLIVDGKGDIDLGSIKYIINTFNEQLKEEDKRKVYIIDLNNPSTSDKYNPFQNKSPTVIKDMLINMTEWSEEHYKTNASRYIQKVIYMMVKDNIEISFESIIKYLSTDNFTALSMRLQKNKQIDKEEHINNVKLAKTSVKTIEGAVARFSLLLESDIGNIFKSDGIDIPSALNEGAIILFILNPLIYPEISPLFGKLITIDAKQGVNSLFHKRFKRTFYIFDEISVYGSEALLQLINLSRSANITSILATQSLSDLEANVSEYFRKQIIESCNNYIVMRQNEPSNAEIWANTLGTKETITQTFQIDENNPTGMASARKTREFLYHPDIIKNLALGEAIYLSKDIGIKCKVKIKKPF